MQEQPTPNEWGARPENLMRIISEKVLLETEQQIENLKEVATIDPLTGLLNRRAWDYEIEKIVKEFARTGESEEQKKYALLALDIDFFKKINDTFGHSGGDVVLVESAKLLKSIFRSTDIIARFGGEEFFVLIKDSDIEKVKERLLSGRENEGPGINFVTTITNEEEGNKQVEVSFSGGLVPVTPSSITEVENAIKKADSLLYEAKVDGRNNIKSVEESFSNLA